MQRLHAYTKWFGNRWFLLPNPMYGGWLSVLFHDDWVLPPGRRREAIEAALNRAKNGFTVDRDQAPRH